MINAKKCVLATLLLLSFSGSAFSGSSVSGLSQQELNKLGQQEAKGNGAYKDFGVKDDQLKEINPEYDKTDLTSTYNSMQAPTAAGNAKKWQCLSYTDAQISGFYKSSVATEKQLAIDCDAIRAAEKTNDKMEGRYGDPLENELVRLFTERQNEQANNSKNGNVNIECSPLGGTSEYTTDEQCLVQMLPVEKTCNRELKVICYNKETGQILQDDIKCGTDKLPSVSVSSLGDWGKSGSNDTWVKWHTHADYTASGTTDENLKNTVYSNFTLNNANNAGGNKTATATWTFNYNPKEHGTPFIKFFKIDNKDGDEGVDNPSMSINGKSFGFPAGRGQTYKDLEGDRQLGADLFQVGENTISVSTRVKNFMVVIGGGGGGIGGGLIKYFTRYSQDTYFIAIGFKGKCVEVVCSETWNESCVEGDIISGDDVDDIIEDDSPVESNRSGSSGGSATQATQ